MSEDKLAKRMQHINPFYVMDILAQAKKLEAQGYDVVHLEVGEPDFNTPDSVKAAGKQAIDEDKTHYTASTGLPELKKKISDYYRQRLSVNINPKNIVITPGASGALQLALTARVNAGGNVLMADPGYPCNRNFTRLLDAKAKLIPVGADTQFQLDHGLIDEAWDENTSAVLLATPSNPTGTLVDKVAMQQIVDVVKKHNGVLLVDEIYQGMVYEQEDFTAAELSKDIFVINSFSKYFSMTGWRLGWLIVPDAYLDAVDRLAQNLFLAPPTISQYAALAAFDKSNLKLLDAQRDELNLRREFLLKGLGDLGFEISVKPEGAFYIYADVSKFTDDSFQFCHDLLQQVKVAITPGKDFGHHQQNCYVRFAYTQKIEKLQMALDRIGDFLSLYKY